MVSFPDWARYLISIVAYVFGSAISGAFCVGGLGFFIYVGFLLTYRRRCSQWTHSYDEQCFVYRSNKCWVCVVSATNFSTVTVANVANFWGCIGSAIGFAVFKKVWWKSFVIMVPFVVIGSFFGGLLGSFPWYVLVLRVFYVTAVIFGTAVTIGLFILGCTGITGKITDILDAKKVGAGEAIEKITEILKWDFNHGLFWCREYIDRKKLFQTPDKVITFLNRVPGFREGDGKKNAQLFATLRQEKAQKPELSETSPETPVKGKKGDLKKQLKGKGDAKKKGDAKSKGDDKAQKDVKNKKGDKKTQQKSNTEEIESKKGKKGKKDKNGKKGKSEELDDVDLELADGTKVIEGQIVVRYRARLLLIAPIALIGGFVGSILGITGGPIYVILLAAQGLPWADSIGTSLLLCIFEQPLPFILRFAIGRPVYWLECLFQVPALPVALVLSVVVNLFCDRQLYYFIIFGLLMMFMVLLSIPSLF